MRSPARRRALATGFVSLAVLAFSAACAPHRGPDESRPRADLTAEVTAEVTAMMQRSAQAWNRGDLDAFMRDYLPGDRTTYVTSRGVVRGPEAIKARYAPRFAPGALHDSLSFEGVEVDPLAPGVVNVIGWYVLTRGDSLIARGPTSLVMVRHEGRWAIVHDHSS